MVGIKSRVSVLGHVRGVARPARERRKAVREGEVESREERADEGKNRGPQQNRLIALRHRPRRSTAHPSPPPPPLPPPSQCPLVCMHARRSLSLFLPLSPFPLSPPFSPFLLLADSLRLDLRLFLLLPLSFPLPSSPSPISPAVSVSP